MANTHPHWLDFARTLIGTREIPGQKHSPAIISWLKALKSWVTDDETPWCGTFLAYVMLKAGYSYPVGYLTARKWSDYGYYVKPGEGAILVFWRGSPTGASGHVGIYVGEDDTHYHVLGGNQSDMVNVSRIAKSRLLTSRWPITPPSTRWNPPVVRLAPNGKPSTNEA